MTAPIRFENGDGLPAELAHLLGRKIVGVRPLNRAEMVARGWPPGGASVCLVLSDCTVLYARSMVNRDACGDETELRCAAPRDEYREYCTSCRTRKLLKPRFREAGLCAECLQEEAEP